MAEDWRETAGVSRPASATTLALAEASEEGAIGGVGVAECCGPGKPETAVAQLLRRHLACSQSATVTATPCHILAAHRLPQRLWFDGLCWHGLAATNVVFGAPDTR